jgi:hypothetical protein
MIWEMLIKVESDDRDAEADEDGGQGSEQG